MTTNRIRQEANKVGLVTGFTQACLKSCDKILARIKEAKTAILAEAQGNSQASEQMLRLAVNEAEAIAWQTYVPHLIFPTLALERVQAVSNWNARQQVVRRVNPALALAA
jgi:hypothetical protein